MFRIICVLVLLGLGYFAYDSYGYRYMIANVIKDADQNMTMGSIDPNINIVAYVDYDSASSRRLYPTLLNLLASDPNVRVIIRPIETNDDISRLATRVALAAKEQNKFMSVNNVFLTSGTNIDARYIESAVRSLGLDYNRLNSATASLDIEQQALDLQSEAAWLSIDRFPYVFVEHVKMPNGVYSLSDLKTVIKNIRSRRR